jgi:hypothetical protein
LGSGGGSVGPEQLESFGKDVAELLEFQALFLELILGVDDFIDFFDVDGGVEPQEHVFEGLPKLGGLD